MTPAEAQKFSDRITTEIVKSGDVAIAAWDTADILARLITALVLRDVITEHAAKIIVGLPAPINAPADAG
jgi:hypothetical protein